MTRRRPALQMRRASAAEREQLSALAFRSKATWGYSQEFMEACRAELAVREASIASGLIFVAEDEGGIAGFYGLEPLSAGSIELSHCFVEPAAIGTGVGRALLAHALEEARKRGSSLLVIQSDPYAASFYARLGARAVGTRESDSIPGRVLPVFELDL
jgi:GNAT superfamily N-acetyltransferase